jgi:hypothetical protein
MPECLDHIPRSLNNGSTAKTLAIGRHKRSRHNDKNGTKGDTKTMNFGNLTANQDMATLPGTTAGTSAGVGNIDEIFIAGIPGGSPVGLTSGVPANVTSIALSAGDWEVSGIVTLKYTSATQSGDGQAGLNVLSATLPGDNVRGFDNTRQTATTSNASITFPLFNFNSASPQTAYLVAQASFSAGSCAAFGNIQARQVR